MEDLQGPLVCMTSRGGSQTYANQWNYQTGLVTAYDAVHFIFQFCRDSEALAHCLLPQQQSVQQRLCEQGLGEDERVSGVEEEQLIAQTNGGRKSSRAKMTNKRRMFSNCYNVCLLHFHYVRVLHVFWCRCRGTFSQ